MTEYEQGQHDATIAILKEFRLFKRQEGDRTRLMFDDADILEVGCQHCREQHRPKAA